MSSQIAARMHTVSALSWSSTTANREGDQQHPLESLRGRTGTVGTTG